MEIRKVNLRFFRYMMGSMSMLSSILLVVVFVVMTTIIILTLGRSSMMTLIYSSLGKSKFLKTFPSIQNKSFACFASVFMDIRKILSVLITMNPRLMLRITPCWIKIENVFKSLQFNFSHQKIFWKYFFIFG